MLEEDEIILLQTINKLMKINNYPGYIQVYNKYKCQITEDGK